MGQGCANPIATILSAAMMLRHSLGLGREAKAIEQAVSDTLTAGARTRDLGGKLSSREMTDQILSRLS